MTEKYKVENDFLILADGQKIHIPTLEIICGLNPIGNESIRTVQAGQGNINIIISGKNNKVTFKGGIKNSNR